MAEKEELKPNFKYENSVFSQNKERDRLIDKLTIAHRHLQVLIDLERSREKKNSYLIEDLEDIKHNYMVNIEQQEEFIMLYLRGRMHDLKRQSILLP